MSIENLVRFVLVSVLVTGFSIWVINRVPFLRSIVYSAPAPTA